jgi:hypothetical protein
VSQTHDDIRAVRLMVDELRAEPPPDLPWDAMEKRLLAAIAASSTPPRLAPSGRQGSRWGSSPLGRVIGFAAAAAVLALGIGSQTSDLPGATAPAPHVVEVSAVAMAPGYAEGVSAHDLSQLRAGDVVEASTDPVSFAQAGLVAWTLAPGSALRVRSTGMGHTVALERGSIRAEVTPRDPAEGLVEAFAVEVAGTRVAVHGTAFTVKLEGNRIVVDVEHGTVAVGPVGHVGATTGRILVGPARASFSLDGGRTARILAPEPWPVVVASANDRAPDAAPQPALDPAPAAPTDRAQAPGAAAALPAAKPALAAHAPAQPAPPAAGPAAPAAPAEPPRLTVDVVRSRLERCFRQTTDAARESGASTLHIDPISTTLAIDLNPDGSVLKARFTNQMKPELYPCAGSAIHGRFPDGLGHVDIPVTFQP